MCMYTHTYAQHVGGVRFFENRDFEAASPMGYAKMKGYQRVGVRWLLSLAKLGYGGLAGNSVVGISKFKCNLS